MSFYGFFAIAFSVCLFYGCSVGKPVEASREMVGEQTENAWPEEPKRVQVLVELFTSEGCSSCPPADRALALLEKEQPAFGAEIIALAMHVDYWDYLGWKDPFASPLITQRQRIYGQKFGLSSVYTPQMVVDGRYEFVGSDLGKAQKAIASAIKNERAEIKAELTDDGISIEVLSLPKHEDSTIHLAVVEDGLASDVLRGENSGKRLEHISVVRELRAIGTIGPGETNFKVSVEVPKNSAKKEKKLKFVIFVQENERRNILGSVKIS